MAVTRELTIRYGGYSLHPVGKIRMEKGYERSLLEFSFLVSSTTAAGFAAACQGAEMAFRKPQQNASVVVKGSQVFSIGPSNSGFDSDPVLTKGEDVADVEGRSRVYHARIEYGMPADTGVEEQVGLRSYSVELTYTPARRRTATIAGTFTAVGGVQARAQYDAKIAALNAAVTAALTGTWERINERSERNTYDTLLEFSDTFEELIFDQGAAGTRDDPEIVKQQLKISRARDNSAGFTPFGPGGYGGTAVDPLVIVTANYDAWIDHTATTALAAKYAAIRPWLLDQITTIAGASKWALVEEEPQYDLDNNRISARLVVHTIGVTDVFENEVTVTDDLDPGYRIVGIWTGNPLEKYVYDGIAEFTRTVSQTMKKTIADPGPSIVAGETGAAYDVALGHRDAAKSLSPLSGGSLTMLTVKRTGSVTVKKKGLDGNAFDFVEVQATTVFNGFIPYAGSDYNAGGSGGGGGGEATPGAPSGGASGGEAPTSTVNEPVVNPATSADLEAARQGGGTIFGP